MYSTNSGIKFKTLMLKSILCDYSDASVPGTLRAISLGNLLIRKGVMTSGKETIRVSEGTIAAGQHFQCYLIGALE